MPDGETLICKALGNNQRVFQSFKRTEADCLSCRQPWYATIYHACQVSATEKFNSSCPETNTRNAPSLRSCSARHPELTSDWQGEETAPPQPPPCSAMQMQLFCFVLFFSLIFLFLPADEADQRRPGCSKG